MGHFKKVIAIVGLIVGGASPAVSQSTCASVYENAVANVSTSSRETTEKSYVFNLYCESTGSTKDWVSSASVSFPIKGIPISASGDGDFSQEELREFCKIGSESNYAFGAEFGYNRDIAVKALTSFNQCVKIEQNSGLTLTYQAAPPESIVISARFSGIGIWGTLDAVVYDKDLVTCESANFTENGEKQVLHGAMAIDIGDAQFSISCVRKPESLEDGRYYPYASVQVSTSFGPFTVVMPADKLFGYKTASAAESTIAELTTRLAGVEESNRSATQRADALQNAIRSHRLLSVYQGDGGWQGSSDVREPCPQQGGEYVNRDSYMENVCVRNGLKYSGWKFTGDHGGGICGHSWYAVICY